MAPSGPYAEGELLANRFEQPWICPNVCSNIRNPSSLPRAVLPLRARGEPVVRRDYGP
jgi:hypothetical protein